MDISDIGDNPVRLAKEILRQIGNPDCETPLLEIASALGIEEILEDPKLPVEGALYAPEGKNFGLILLNPSKDDRRTRFTLAHEIGHYVHPLHFPSEHASFLCSNSDLQSKRSETGTFRENQEAQANEFAAELILPSHYLSRYIEKSDLISTDSIVEMSDRFLVSREAAFRRVVENSKRSIAAFYIKDGTIRYFSKSNSFPFPRVWGKKAVPKGSWSATMELKENFSSQVREVEPRIWINDDREVCMTEQTFMQENGYQIVLLNLMNI